MTTPRIVNDVLKAYKKTKLKPSQGVWCNNKSACALGALMCAKTGSKESEKLEEKANDLLGEEYVSEFICGFDEYDSETTRTFADIKDGYSSHKEVSGYWHGYLTAKKVFAK